MRAGAGSGTTTRTAGSRRSSSTRLSGGYPRHRTRPSVAKGRPGRLLAVVVPLRHRRRPGACGMTTTRRTPATASLVAAGRRPGDGTTRRVTGANLVVLAAYVGTIVTANWASTHWSALLVGAVAVPAGMLWAEATFTLRDLPHECLGGRGAHCNRGRSRTVLAAGHTTDRGGQCARVHRLRIRRVPCVLTTAGMVCTGRGDRLEPGWAGHRQRAVRADGVRVLRLRARPDPRQDGRAGAHRRRARRSESGPAGGAVMRSVRAGR